jgi:hypothetical protein
VLHRLGLGFPSLERRNLYTLLQPSSFRNCDSYENKTSSPPLAGPPPFWAWSAEPRAIRFLFSNSLASETPNFLKHSDAPASLGRSCTVSDLVCRASSHQILFALTFQLRKLQTFRNDLTFLPPLAGLAPFRAWSSEPRPGLRAFPARFGHADTVSHVSEPDVDYTQLAGQLLGPGAVRARQGVRRATSRAQSCAVRTAFQPAKPLLLDDVLSVSASNASKMAPHLGARIAESEACCVEEWGDSSTYLSV